MKIIHFYSIKERSLENQYFYIMKSLEKLRDQFLDLRKGVIDFDAHFQLVSIHPWEDGNGRTSRLLMNYIQHFHNEPLSIENSTDKTS